jgi:hypothetical protein
MAYGSRATHVSATRSGRIYENYDGIDDIDKRRRRRRSRTKQSTHGRQVAVRRNIVTLDGLASLGILIQEIVSKPKVKSNAYPFHQG